MYSPKSPLRSGCDREARIALRSPGHQVQRPEKHRRGLLEEPSRNSREEKAAGWHRGESDSHSKPKVRAPVFLSEVTGESGRNESIRHRGCLKCRCATFLPHEHNTAVRLRSFKSLRLLTYCTCRLNCNTRQLKRSRSQ